MPFWAIALIVLAIIAAVIWGIQSLNPHAFNAAAKTAAANADKGLAADASKAGSAVGAEVTKVAAEVAPAPVTAPAPAVAPVVAEVAPPAAK